jgi:hypothetical protein
LNLGGNVSPDVCGHGSYDVGGYIYRELGGHVFCVWARSFGCVCGNVARESRSGDSLGVIRGGVSRHG